MVRLLDGIGAWIASWLPLCCLLMVVLGAFNACARKLGPLLGFSLSSNAFLEAQWILFSVVFLLGAPSGLRRGDHVRVDILLSRLTPHLQARIALVGHLLLLLPFCLILGTLSLGMVEASWRVAEQSPDPGGLPRYPIKTLIPLAFFLLFLQGISEVCKETRKRKANDSPRGLGVEP